MKIEEIVSMNRRDFTAIYKCENCGTEKKGSGYDDRNFHDNVVPNMKCKNCGKSSIDLQTEIEYTETKYESWEVI